MYLDENSQNWCRKSQKNVDTKEKNKMVWGLVVPRIGENPNFAC